MVIDYFSGNLHKVGTQKIILYFMFYLISLYCECHEQSKRNKNKTSKRIITHNLYLSPLNTK